MNIAKAALNRLAELGMTPTQENYAYILRELAKASAHDDPSGDEFAAEGGDPLAVLLRDPSGRSREELQANLLHERDEVLRLLVYVIRKANLIHHSVESAYEDLIAARKTLEQLRAELSETRMLLQEDSLTTTLNRRGMDSALRREFARHRRSGAALTVAMLDVDHFKRVNDIYGHDAGDKTLVHFTGIIRSLMRESDLLARYGGEEFVLILPETDAQGAKLVIERLRLVTQKAPLTYEGHKITVTFSGGVAQIKPDENRHALLTRADAALHAAKDGGRDRIIIAD